MKLFVSEKRFERELDRRLFERDRWYDQDRQMNDLWSRIYKLEDKVLRLERKLGGAEDVLLVGDAVPVESCCSAGGGG